jgi:hypothetical protein
MEHKQPRMAGKYVPAFSWHKRIGDFVREIVEEVPLLHVCSGPDSDFGEVRVDRHVLPIPPATMADWTALPFRDDSFAAVFADPPWNMGHMKPCADFCKEALRVAPVAYVMSPWLWVERSARRSKIWVREFPGINVPILIVRYERWNKAQMSLFEDRALETSGWTV